MGKKLLAKILLATLVIGSVLSTVNFDKPKKALATEPAWANDYANWKYRKKIHIDGSVDGDQTNYVMKLNAHYGDQQGQESSQDIFLNKKSQKNFDDVRFSDENGNPLDYYLANHGNYEIIPDDSSVGEDNFIINEDKPNGLRKGDIVASGGLGGESYGLFVSQDNGETWKMICSNSGAVVFVDSRGYIYYDKNIDFNFYRIKNPLAENPTEEVIFTFPSESEGVPLWSNVDEDSLGDIYVGQYTDNGADDPKIYKITNNDTDNPTVSTVFDFAGYADSQHVHGLRVDPYTDNIYAAVDGSRILFVSDDHGSTWTKIDTLITTQNDIIDMVFYDDRQLFASGAGGMMEGETVLKRDEASGEFSFSLRDQSTPQSLVKYGNDVYGLVSKFNASSYPEIIHSPDRGETWETIYIDDQVLGCFGGEIEVNFCGFRTAHDPGTPKISDNPPIYDDPQILLGGQGTYSGSDRANARLYVAGENRYQGQFYLNIDSLSESGKDIYVYYGNNDAETTSDKTIFDNYDLIDNLLIHYNFDEESGTDIIDSSGNGLNATLSSGSIERNAGDLSLAGSIYPYVETHSGGRHLTLNELGGASRATNATLKALNQNFSVFAWVNLSDADAGDIIFELGYGYSKKWGLTVSSGQKKLMFVWCDGTNDNLSGNIFTPVSIDTEKNTFIGFTAGTIDANGVNGCTSPGGCQDITLWVNGYPSNFSLLKQDDSEQPILGSDTSAFPSFNPDRNLFIGSNNTVFNPMSGSIDDFRLYNRELSQNEIQSLYESRPIADHEPVFNAANNYSYTTQGKSSLFKSVTNTVSSDSVQYNSEPNVSNEVNMTLVPNNGSVDVSINTWNTSGSYSKSWTESSSNTSTSAHTIGDLKQNTYYTVTNGSNWTHTYKSNSSGIISFTYDGGYSTHTFSLTEDSAPPSLSITSPTSTTSSTTSSSLTITGSASDTGSGLSSLTINGTSISNPSNFSATVSLNTGSNTITIIATDNAGNTTTKALTVTRENEVESISSVVSNTTKALAQTNQVTDNNAEKNYTSIIDENNQETKLDSNQTITFTTQNPTIKGKTTPYAEVTIEIHSNPITAIVIADDQGYFEYTPTEALDYGEHTIKITARDKDTQEILESNEYKINIAKESETQKASTSSTANTDTKENTNYLWVWIVLILVILGAGAYFVFRRR